MKNAIISYILLEIKNIYARKQNLMEGSRMPKLHGIPLPSKQFMINPGRLYSESDTHR